MTSNLQSLSPDYETKEIKNIYIDSKFSSSILQRGLCQLFYDRFPTVILFLVLDVQTLFATSF